LFLFRKKNLLKNKLFFGKNFEIQKK